VSIATASSVPTTNDLDGLSFLQQRIQRRTSIDGDVGLHPRHRLLQQRRRLKQKFLKQNRVAFSEGRARRLVNVDVDLDGHRHDDRDHTAAAAAADVGILSTGGAATYGAESLLHAVSTDSSSSSTSNNVADDGIQQGWRHLQENDVIGPDTPVKNSNLTLGDFDYDELSYFVDYDIEYVCSTVPYCACSNNSDGTTTITCEENDYCIDYTSRCGQSSPECFDFKRSATIEDSANFVYTYCLNYTVPYYQSSCSTQVTEDNFVTSCSRSWNGVECQSCQVEPTLLSYDPIGDGACYESENCTEVLAFCYLLDCTNTDLGVEFNDCYLTSGLSQIYNNVHVSAGCEESCEICPEGSGDGTADIETFAATGSYSCAELFDLGSNGYFSVDECAALQSSLPEVCGC
jgi:hypothetical protein